MGFKSFIKDAVPFAGAVVDALSQHSANKTNKKIAREQMAFQERMSSTEMQRRVADLRAAGLNPMLAGMNQQGASSAQGASTRVEPITRNTASTALAVSMQRQQLENMDAQTRLLQAQRSNVQADTNLKHGSAEYTAANTQMVDAQMQKLAVEFKTAQAQYDITEQDLRNRRLTNAQLEKMQPLIEEYQRLINMAESLGMSEKEATSKWFAQFGQSGRGVEAAKNMLLLFQMLQSRGKK